jgi:hypothetical protein
MITSKIHKGFLKKNTVWFANSLNCINAIGFYEYYNCQETKNCWGYIKQNKYTKLINLTKSSDEILSRFNKTTKYEIKRSIRQGAKFEIEPDINAFINFFNKFAKSKNLPLLKIKDLDSLNKYLFISKAIYENECLVMHANIIDPEIKRVQILRSASHFRMFSNNKKRALLGRVNRFLHFMDMMYAKDMNMLIYDLGGYALNTEDEELQNVNKFKDGFRGKLHKECNYTSYPLWLLLKFKRIMNLTLTTLQLSNILKITKM